MRTVTCYFCSQNSQEVDFKDAETLRKFLSAGMKLRHRRQTDTCAKHQRKLADAIKRARQMAILPYLP